jgi:hypothetical protein
MKSHFHRALSISVVAPQDWIRSQTEDFPLLLLAPLRDGTRSNIGFSKSNTAASLPDVLHRVLHASRQQQTSEYLDFEERSVESFSIDQCPAILQTYRWRPLDASQPLHQWFGLVQTTAHGLIELNAFTTAAHAERVSPQIRDILTSIRFIPFAE